MFTVVIAEKEHIDSIKEYQLFLKPFVDESKVVFCEWRQNEETLADSVPQLVETVARNREWRAIVLCDDRGIAQKNPFDLVEFHAPEYQSGFTPEEKQEYLERLQQAKFQAFEQAAKQPLTRLMTRLCEGPLVSEGRNNAAAEDPEFAEYIAESLRKQALREQIIGGEKLGVSRPAEVICIAKRAASQQEYEISTSWASHEEIQYSRFYDWNMYFDKMRYMVFNILPKTHEDYEFDYIRFLYAVLILANNDTPAGTLRPNRVFQLTCENDETALGQLLSLYDAKLAQTSAEIEARIHEIRKTEKPRLSDRDAKHIFCANINVPVTISQEVERDELYADPNSIGLATDCPEEEYGAWDRAYLKSKKTLTKVLKQPRRALKSAVADMRRLNEVDLDKAWYLNEFQAEDVAEHTAEEELSMVSVETPNLFDTEKYHKDMEETCQEIHRKIETRMSRSTTIGLGVTVLVLYLAGFLMLLFNNIGDTESRLWALCVMGGAVVLLALVSFVCLFFLRGGLRELYRKFNRLMHGIDQEIEGSMALYSRYLSHTCNVMRGFSVLNYRAGYEDPDAKRIQILNKHVADIRCAREDLWEVFGHYISKQTGAEQVDAYLFDFERPVDYWYPIPYTEGMKSQIEFMQPGNLIQVPVSFVKRIAIRREELYD